MASTIAKICRRLSTYTHRRSTINDAAAELKTKVGKNLEWAAVFVPLGMVLSTGVMLGLHTAKGQLSHSPSVRLNKKLRGTIPEVEDPVHVAEEGSRYVNRPFFRKNAHAS
ncbi:uncharacterized protein LOC110025443, partial [Phalaenopsis equestris]|uniref:uncharacterized protein LOC110025443 n=1 Tax=Phalaenopsis equestris TaxID=78828 RepID=UPI0009E40A3E